MAVKFSPTVELGHIIQMVGVAVCIGGWALWGYQTIQAEISGQAGTLQLLQQRLDNDEKSFAQERLDQQTRDQKISATLDKIADELTDLKTAIATLNARPVRPE